MAMKKCKECGEEISSSAKVCPKCGKKQGGGALKTVLIVIGVLVLLGLISGSDTSNQSKTTLTSGTNSEVTKTVEENKVYSVGEIYEDSNIAIKFVDFDDNFTGYSEYADVKAGYKVIKAEFEAENLGSTDELFSSYDFNCYADGYDCESFWYFEESGFSSTLSAGKKGKGAVCFEVPENAEEITIEYDLNIWTSKKVIFKVQ